MDCHVETSRCGFDAEFTRAEVVHTATGNQLYVTWPYRSERAAVARARRWMREEYRKADSPSLFAPEGNRQ